MTTLSGIRGYSMDQMEESFWSKVQKTESCWLWQGASGGRDGRYGRWYAGRVKDFAHRMSFVIHKGAIPSGYIIRHMCHVRKCVNPAHLEVGTYKDNTQDAVKAGRMCSGERRKATRLHLDIRGEGNPTAIMTVEKVQQIRFLWDYDLASRRELAQEYGVSEGCIYGITSRKNWSHV